MIILDTTVVNVALPSIGHEFGGAVTDLQWVMDAYTLMFAALLLSSGALSDRVGARRAYVIGLSGFTAASLACGLAPSLGLLIAARVVQGATAAMMLPSSLALVRQSFPDAAARARGIAIWTAAGGVAMAAGPVVGGALTTLPGWRSIFFLNLPFGTLALLGLLRTGRSPARPAPFDLPGQIAATVWMAALTFAVIEAGARGLGSPLVIVALGAFAVGLAAFLAVESHRDVPMVPLRLFRHPTVSTCVAVGFVLNLTTYGLIFILSLYLQQVLHVTSLVAGLMFLPMTAVITAVNMLAGRMTTRFGFRLPMVLGQAILALGMLGLLLVGEATPTPLLLALLIPIGVGAGMAVPPMTTALLNTVDAASAGLASGILNAGRQVGGALGVAVFGALVSGTAWFATGMHLSLALGAGLLLATITGSMALL